MVENMPFHLKYWNECHQCENDYKNAGKDSEKTPNWRGPWILLFIVQRSPILPNGEIFKSGEPTRAVDNLLIFCLGRRELREFLLVSCSYGCCIYLDKSSRKFFHYLLIIMASLLSSKGRNRIIIINLTFKFLDP